MSKFANVDALNKHMITRSYVSGFSLSSDDKDAFAALSTFPSAATHPHAYRWAKHVHNLTGAMLGASSSAAAPVAAKKAQATEDMDDMFGDDDDMFGDDEEVNDDLETAEEAKATEARRARMQKAADLQAAAKAKKDAASGKAEKEKPVEKSLIVLEVKPWEADTDLKMVWEKIIEFEKEGLTWGVSYKLEPVAYGIMKLVMTCSIIDSMILQDDITDAIEALEDWVQSVQVVSMNKI